MEGLLEVLNHKDFALICKYIWSRLNQFIFENQFDNPNSIYHKALFQLEEFQQSYLLDTKATNNPIVNQICEGRRWKKWPRLFESELGCLCRSASQLNRYGGIIRNCKEDVMASFNVSRSPDQSPEVAEATALRKIMLIYAELGFHRIVSLWLGRRNQRRKMGQKRVLLFTISSFYLGGWKVGRFVFILEKQMQSCPWVLKWQPLRHNLWWIEDCLVNVLSFF